MPDKVTSSDVASGSTLIPDVSDGYATGAGAAGFETNDKTYAPTPGAGSHGGSDTVDKPLESVQSK